MPSEEIVEQMSDPSDNEQEVDPDASSKEIVNQLSEQESDNDQEENDSQVEVAIEKKLTDRLDDVMDKAVDMMISKTNAACAKLLSAMEKKLNERHDATFSKWLSAMEKKLNDGLGATTDGWMSAVEAGITNTVNAKLSEELTKHIVEMKGAVNETIDKNKCAYETQIATLNSVATHLENTATAGVGHSAAKEFYDVRQKILRSGIMCYWKDMPEHVRAFIYQCFEQMGPNDKTTKNVRRINISNTVWSFVFKFPDVAENNDLKKYPNVVQRLVKKLPPPKTFDIATVESMIASNNAVAETVKAAKAFLKAYKMLKSPWMIAIGWERNHYIHPAETSDLKSYLGDTIELRAERSLALQNACAKYSKAVGTLAQAGVIHKVAIVDPAVPIISKYLSGWDIQDTSTPESIRKELSALNKAEPHRMWFFDDLRQHPFFTLQDKEDSKSPRSTKSGKGK